MQKPSSLGLSCDRAQVHLLNLPSLVQCEVNSTSFMITLNGTLAPGEYAFVLTAATPADTPPDNSFAVLLRDSKLAVQDAAMNLPGPKFQPAVKVVRPSLAWTSAEPGQASRITVRFAVSAAIQAYTVGSLLITFPQNFEHNIEKVSEVVSKNDQLAVRSGSAGVGVHMVDRLLVRLDASIKIPAGEYGFEFPVTVPEFIPPYNVWLLSFCTKSMNDNVDACTHAFDAGVLVTFPLAGFSISASPGLDGFVGAARGGAPAAVLPLAAVALAWWV